MRFIDIGRCRDQEDPIVTSNAYADALFSAEWHRPERVVSLTKALIAEEIRVRSRWLTVEDSDPDEEFL